MTEKNMFARIDAVQLAFFEYLYSNVDNKSGELVSLVHDLFEEIDALRNELNRSHE